MQSPGDIRKRGFVFVGLGIALTVGAYVAARVGIGVSALVLFVSPAMITVGLAMAIAPAAPSTGDVDFDLADWMESLPLSRRIALYAVGALGMAIGALLILQLGGWTVSGAIQVVF